MREKAFENQVKTFLTSRGCWWVKTFSDGYQRAGIPDLIVCCKGRFIGVELKSETGRASKLQEHEISEIRKADGLAMVLRPQGFEKFKEMIDGLQLQQG